MNRRSAYHPQSDGQTEVVNRGVKTCFRCFCGERPEEWIKWLHWVEYWYNTVSEIFRGNTLLSVYKHLPPPLVYYDDRDTPNSALDEQLKERDIMLGALKEHLRIAHPRKDEEKR